MEPWRVQYGFNRGAKSFQFTQASLILDFMVPGVRFVAPQDEPRWAQSESEMALRWLIYNLNDAPTQADICAYLENPRFPGIFFVLEAQKGV